MRHETKRLAAWNVLLVAALAAPTESFCEPAFPSSRDSWIGGHLRLGTLVDGFREQTGADGVKQGDSASNTASKPAFCAPPGSTLYVTHQTEAMLYVKFKSVAFEGASSEAAEMLEKCPPARQVRTYVAYSVSTEDLAGQAFFRTGLEFGGLVVPFKLRLGDVRSLDASPTIAPYIGYRTSWFQSYGLTFTPVVSAGLALITVNDPSADPSSSKNTKPAVSTAVGLLLRSSAHDQFNAGILIGKDFAGETDRDLDPSLNKWWFSLYLGVAF